MQVIVETADQLSCLYSHHHDILVVVRLHEFAEGRLHCPDGHPVPLWKLFFLLEDKDPVECQLDGGEIVNLGNELALMFVICGPGLSLAGLAMS